MGKQGTGKRQFPCPLHEDMWWGRLRTEIHSFLTSTPDKGGCSNCGCSNCGCSNSSPGYFNPRKEPRYPLNGLHSQCERVRRKISCSYWHSNPGPSSRYRVRCKKWAIPSDKSSLLSSDSRRLIAAYQRVRMCKRAQELVCRSRKIYRARYKGNIRYGGQWQYHTSPVT
jgi:hypothetical protein